MGKVVEFKLREKYSEQKTISPETIKKMSNQQLIESTKFLSNFVADAQDEDEQDDFMDLLYDAIEELENRLNLYGKLNKDYQNLFKIMKENAINNK